jgi:hypothetical protein
MPRVRDVPCAGTCGTLIWRGKGSLPPGQAKCQPCRATDRANPTPRDCSVCGAAFDSPGRSTCSRRCYLARMAQVSALGSAVLRKPSPRCEVCGVPFRRTYGAQLTCGRECGLALRRAKIRTCSCATCGNDFARSVISQQKFCSPVCQLASQPKTLKSCLECGSTFEPGKGTGYKYCGVPCLRLRRRRIDLVHHQARHRVRGITRLGERTGAQETREGQCHWGEKHPGKLLGSRHHRSPNTAHSLR